VKINTKKLGSFAYKALLGFVGSFASGIVILVITLTLQTAPAPTQNIEKQQQIIVAPKGDVNVNITFNCNNVEKKIDAPQPKLGGTQKKKKKSYKKRH